MRLKESGEKHEVLLCGHCWWLPGKPVGRRGYPDCDNTQPPCLPVPSSKDLGTGEGSPSEEAEAEGNKDTPSLPALLIGHIRLSSIHVEGLGVAAVLFQQCRARMWKPDPWRGRGAGCTVTEMEGQVDSSPVRQVCTAPSSQGMTPFPSALWNRQLTATAHLSEKIAGPRSQARPGNVPQLQMHEASDPM